VIEIKRRGGTLKHMVPHSDERVLNMPPRKEKRSYGYNLGTRMVLCLLIGVSSFPLLNGRCKITLTPINFLFTYKH
jgi:hypothetical protein